MVKNLRAIIIVTYKTRLQYVKDIGDQQLCMSPGIRPVHSKYALQNPIPIFGVTLSERTGLVSGKIW